MLGYKPLFPKIIGLWGLICTEGAVKFHQTPIIGQKWSKMVVLEGQFLKNV